MLALFIFGPALVYWALSWVLRPASVLATCAAPFAWGALAFTGAMAYFGPGGQLPQVPIILSAIVAAVAAAVAFLGALAILVSNRKHANAIAVANGLAWLIACLISFVS